jgi:hypothetical protein
MIPFYGAADNAIYNQGYSFIPQEQYRGAFTPKTIGSDDNTNSSTTTLPPRTTNNSRGAGITGIGGNAFGYGSAIDPVSYGQYGAPGYMGGLPGGVKQFGVGRQFTDPSASPIGETYSYEKTVPAFARFAAGFIPFGNTALNFVEKRMNANRDQPSGSYAIGGLNDFQKGAYNQLAGQGMLFSGTSGLKTATGKNFGAKGYFEGQKEIFDNLTDKGFSLNDDDEVVDSFGNVITGFRALQYKEALANQNYKNYTDKKEAEKIQKELEAAAAAKSKAKALAAIKKQGQADYNPNIHGSTNYGIDSKGNQSFSGESIGAGNLGFGIGSDGGPVSNKTGRGRTGFMGGGLTNLVDIYD